jgi:regulator of PEP synthase PpsR (kinase-PPPase family)
MKRTVFFVSDRTGITVQALGASLLTQFEQATLERVSIPYVDTRDKARAAVRRIDAAAEADGAPALVFSTLIDPGCREVLGSANAVLFDFFDTFLGPLEAALGVRSSRAVGRAHGMGNATEYQVRMNAVNYALNLDDGVHSARLDQADIVLLGVSRSGKTPTCLYLALEFGIHAANYPLTEEDFDEGRLPEAVRPLQGRLAGLTIAPERLHEIREERRAGSRYASLAQCRYEVDEALRLMRRERIPVIDATHVSIEEIATMLVHEHGLPRRVLR